MLRAPWRGGRATQLGWLLAGVQQGLELQLWRGDLRLRLCQALSSSLQRREAISQSHHECAGCIGLSMVLYLLLDHSY